MKSMKIILVIMSLILMVSENKSGAANSNSIIEDGIEYYIQTDKSIYDLGEDVEMLFRVTNVGDDDVLIPCYQSPEFNLLVQIEGETIWKLVHYFKHFSPGIELTVGEFIELPYTWDMKDDNDNQIDQGIYNTIGVMYNYRASEIGAPITIVPEPSSFLLLTAGTIGFRLRCPIYFMH